MSAMSEATRASGERMAALYGRQAVDRLPRLEFSIWTTALARWCREGLPFGWGDILPPGAPVDESSLPEEVAPEMSPALREHFHFDPIPMHHLSVGSGGCEAPLYPAYEPCVVESLGAHEIIQDVSGRHLRVFAGRRHGFMPEYVRHPVRGRRDWEEEVKPRLAPEAPGRWQRFDREIQAARQAREQGLMLRQSLIGGYMFLRVLIGPEDLLYTFYDDPELIHDMMRQWMRLMDYSVAKVQAELDLDELYLDEDICYNHGLLISPAMFEQFLLRYYQQVVGAARRRQKGKLYFQVDTDGYAVPAIPLYLKCGMDVMTPFEVAGGNDLLAIAEDYPDLILIGGIDKRVLAEGRSAIAEHLRRVVPPLVRQGGFVPMCDHGVPDDVSYRNYLYYRELMCELDH